MEAKAKVEAKVEANRLDALLIFLDQVVDPGCQEISDPGYQADDFKLYARFETKLILVDWIKEKV